MKFVEQVTEEWPTIALLLLQADTDHAGGFDRGVEQALEAYQELGFTRDLFDGSSSERTDARRRITRSLYRHRK